MVSVFHGNRVNMKALYLYIINAIVLSFFLAAILPQRDCQNVRNGKYYFQPRNSSKKFLVIRTDSIQKEVEVNSHDTSYWKINWITDCSFTLEFGNSTKNLTIQEKSFYASRKVVVKIVTVTKDYYSFKVDFDSISSRSLSDTLWMLKEIK